MNKTVFFTAATALAAGFLGGAAAHSVFTVAPVHAQVLIEPPTPAPPGNAPIQRPGRRPAPGEVSAERFVIVDHDGNVFGVLGMNGDHPEIDLYDKTGKVVWRVPFKAGVTPLAMAR